MTFLLQSSVAEFEKLRLEMSELEKQEEEFRRKEDDLKKEERVLFFMSIYLPSELIQEII